MFIKIKNMTPIIDHIQLTVKDIKIAEPFYDKLMPILGFDLNRKGKGRVEKHDFDVVEYYHPQLIFGINSPRELFKNDKARRDQALSAFRKLEAILKDRIAP